MVTGVVRRLHCSPRSCLTKRPQRIDFFHGLSSLVHVRSLYAAKSSVVTSLDSTSL